MAASALTKKTKKPLFASRRSPKADYYHYPYCPRPWDIEPAVLTPKDDRVVISQKLLGIDADGNHIKFELIGEIHNVSFQQDLQEFFLAAAKAVAALPSPPILEE